MKPKKKKFKKTFNANLLKNNYSYTAEEVSQLLGARKESVLLWHKKEGLQIIDDKKPYLFKGIILKEFIKNRQKQRKHKCTENQFFCMKCRQPRESAGNRVIILIRNPKELNIKGFCAVCGTKINKKNAVQNLAELRKIYSVERVEHKHLIDYAGSIVNTSLEEDLKNGQKYSI